MTRKPYQQMFMEFAEKHEGCLADLRALMEQRIWEASRDLISANDDNIMRALRGEITICHEISDGIEAALTEKEAAATAGVSGGNPPPAEGPWTMTPSESLG